MAVGRHFKARKAGKLVKNNGKPWKTDENGACMYSLCTFYGLTWAMIVCIRSLLTRSSTRRGAGKLLEGVLHWDLQRRLGGRPGFCTFSTCRTRSF